MWWIANRGPAAEHAEVIKKLMARLDAYEKKANDLDDGYASVKTYAQGRAEIRIGIDQDWAKRATVDRDTLEWLRVTRSRLHKIYREINPPVWKYGKRGGEKQAAEESAGHLLDGLLAASKAFTGTNAGHYVVIYEDTGESLWLEGWAVRINGYKHHVVTKEF